MPDWARWLLAIGLLLVLVAVFIISFILYRKTPVPKGCENLEKPSEAKCHGCNITGCHFNLYYNTPEEQAKAEYEKEKKEAEEMKEDSSADKEEK